MPDIVNPTPPQEPAGLRNGLQGKWSAAKQAWNFYFCAATAEDREAGWTHPGPLGTDQTKAQAIADVLFPALKEFRSGVTPIALNLVPFGTLDWMVEEYKKTRFFLGEIGVHGSARVIEFTEDGKPVRKLLAKHKNRLWHIDLIRNFRLEDGRRVGELPLTEITPLLREALYEALLYTERFNKKTGKVEAVERRTTRNKAFTYTRSMWNVMRQLFTSKVVPENPFNEMRMHFEYGEFPAATYEELERFVEAADRMGHPSIGTAALIGWEWAQRGEHILGDLDVSDYRPSNEPDLAFIRHPKTSESVWMPLRHVDDDAPLFAKLTSRLDKVVQGRSEGPMIFQDHVFRKTGRIKPWGKLGTRNSRFHELVREIIKEARIRECLSFASFRQGGLTECGDAELTDAEIRHISRHKNAKVLRRYIKRTARSIGNAQRKRTNFRNRRKAAVDPILTKAPGQPR